MRTILNRGQEISIEGERGYYRTAMACSAAAALVALSVLLPFLNKAFTVDDVTFLFQSQHLLVDPLHPTAFNMVADGVRVRLSQALVSGPVMAYLLVPSVALGGSEWVAHMVELLFLLTGTVATAVLGLRLGLDRLHAGIAALLVVASPAVIGMAGTAMPDVPAMALGVVGMERFIAWYQTRQVRKGLAAALLLALGALSRPHVLLLLGCAAVWILCDARPFARSRPSSPFITLSRMTMPILLSLGIICLVVYVTRDPASGDSVANATLNRLDNGHLTFNLLSFFLHWVVAFPLALLWPLLRGARFANPRRAYAPFCISALLVVGGGDVGLDFRRAFLILVGTALSLSVFGDILSDAWRRRDRMQLMLGVWLLIALPTAVYIQLPAKNLIPSAPAMAILLARQLQLVKLGRARRMAIGAIGLAGVIVGLLIIRADSALAEIGRKGGRVVAMQKRIHQNVWMDGGWGFQWYAMKAGAIPLADTEPFPKPGDVVVASLKSGLIEQFPDRTLLYSHVFAEAGGRVDSDYATFFTNTGGHLPWVWAHDELGRIEVWRIDSAVQRQKRSAH